MEYKMVIIVCCIILVAVIIIKLDTLYAKKEIISIVNTLTKAVSKCVSTLNSSMESNVHKMHSIGMNNLNELYKINAMNNERVKYYEQISQGTTSSYVGDNKSIDRSENKKGISKSNDEVNSQSSSANNVSSMHIGRELNSL
jgi:hypothetical protein